MAYLGAYVGQYVGAWYGSVGSPPPPPPSPQPGPQQGGGGGLKKKIPFVMAYTYRVGESFNELRAEVRTIKSAQMIESLAARVQAAVESAEENSVPEFFNETPGIGSAEPTAAANQPLQLISAGELLPPQSAPINIRSIKKQKTIERDFAKRLSQETFLRRVREAADEAIALELAREEQRELEEEDDIIAALY